MADSYWLWVLLGAVGTLPLVYLGRRRSPRGERFQWATGLWMAAWIYVGFAVWGGAGLDWLGIELAGVAVYGALAWAGRSRSVWLAVGWALHVLWDVLLHGGHGMAFVPTWYPPACLGFDVAVAAYWLGPGGRRSR